MNIELREMWEETYITLYRGPICSSLLTCVRPYALYTLSLTLIPLPILSFTYMRQSHYLITIYSLFTSLPDLSVTHTKFPHFIK
jgi:hypothetical protein